MPVVLNFMERLGLLHLNKGPGPMVDMIGALGFKAVCVALQLNIFELLEKRPLSAKELTEKIDAKPEGVILLLEALVNLGYIVSRERTYENSEMVRRWMLNDSPESLVGLACHFEDALKRWDYLGYSIRKGEKAPGLDRWFDKHDEGWTRYHTGMRSIANLVADTVVSRVTIPDRARRLLDIGGSHGLYSIRFCMAHPGLSATVLDFPESRATAEETIAREAMQDRITFLAGDFVNDAVEGAYDVLLMFNFIRIFAADKLVPLLEKAARLLNDGGMIVILDQFGQPNMSRFTRTNHSLMLLELFNQLYIRAHTSDKTLAYLKDAGFISPLVEYPQRSGGLGIVTAYKSS